MRIIGYHATEGIIANSDGEYCTEQPFIDFLLEPKPESIKVFYHMEYSVANILRMLEVSEMQAKRLQEESELLAEPYFIKHRAGKFISIKKGHYWNSPFANFSDMNQYKPADFPMIMGKEAHTGQPSEVEWCIHAAREAQKIGEEVYNALVSIGLKPTSLTSPVNVYGKQVLSKVSIPTIDDMPEEAGYYAYQCCQGNWLEAFQLGHWNMTWDYDINSAYPAELMKLLDIRLGEWKKSAEWIPEAEYAFCKGTVMIHAPFSPVIFNREIGVGSEDIDLSYTPTGTWERFLTKEKVEFIRGYGIGKFDMVDGWFWIPRERNGVLGSLIGQLYWEKEKSTGIRREVIKRVMSGIWGKLLQVTKEGFGEIFNPAWGAEVESNVRVEVARFVLNNGINPIHVSVDGVTSPTQVVLSNGEKVAGRWELASAAPAICAGTAQLAIKERRRVADFSIDYDWLVEQIKENPEAKEYNMEKLSPITMAVAINTRDWEHLGQLRAIKKTVHVGGELKRHYKEEPKCGRELLSRTYGSEPWDASLLDSPIAKETT